MANEQIKEQVIGIIGQLGRGTADEIVKKIEAANPETDNKELIAATHQALTELHADGKLKGTDQQGSIIYSLPSA